jgi:large subunit ribosomal protein L21
MYAIVVDGGRQYKVEEGQQINLDYRDLPTGESITLERVLLVSGEAGVKLGQPTVAGATVQAEVLGLRQGDKIYIQKLRRRKNHRRRTGHRQIYTAVKITKINA